MGKININGFLFQILDPQFVDLEKRIADYQKGPQTLNLPTSSVRAKIFSKHIKFKLK